MSAFTDVIEPYIEAFRDGTAEWRDRHPECRESVAILDLDAGSPLRLYVGTRDAVLESLLCYDVPILAESVEQLPPIEPGIAHVMHAYVIQDGIAHTCEYQFYAPIGDVS